MLARFYSEKSSIKLVVGVHGGGAKNRIHMRVCRPIYDDTTCSKVLYHYLESLEVIQLYFPVPSSLFD